ncbi:MAG: hypothetical protein GY787_09115 [Alteromonadales bacterium]|nr:hypothetical protein [Alteromonadales bacterium]
MNLYHVFTKSGVSVVLDSDDPTFLEEKYQLAEQGFEKICQSIKANTKEEALKMAGQPNLADMNYIYSGSEVDEKK